MSSSSQRNVSTVVLSRPLSWPTVSKSDRSHFADLNTPLPGPWQEPFEPFPVAYVTPGGEKRTAQVEPEPSHLKARSSNPKFANCPWLIESEGNRKRLQDRETLEVHPQDRAWARSQKRHAVDPNFYHPERMSKEGAHGSGSIPAKSTSGELWAILGEHIEIKGSRRDDTAQDFHRKLSQSVKATLTSLLRDALKNRSRLSFGTEIEGVRQRIRENAAAIQKLREDYDLAEKSQCESIEFWEDKLRQEFQGDYDKESDEADENIRQAFKALNEDNPEEWLAIYQLLRFADIFRPARPCVSPEPRICGGIKLRGYKSRTLRRVDAGEDKREWFEQGGFNSETDRDDLGNSEDSIPSNAKAEARSDDEDLGDCGFDGEGVTNEGIRRTHNPTDLAELRRQFSFYRSYGLLTRDDVKKDAIDYVATLNHIPRKYIAIYKNKTKYAARTKLVRPTECVKDRWAVRINTDRLRTYVLDVEKFRTSPQDNPKKLAVLAFDVLRKKTWREAVRQTRFKCSKASADALTIARKCKEAGERIDAAFDDVDDFYKCQCVACTEGHNT
jgi:hypothetical protein